MEGRQVFLVQFIDEVIHAAVKQLCAKKTPRKKKITLSFLHALPQTVTLQLSIWDELEIFRPPLVADQRLFNKYIHGLILPLHLFAFIFLYPVLSVLVPLHGKQRAEPALRGKSVSRLNFARAEVAQHAHRLFYFNIWLIMAFLQ